MKRMFLLSLAFVVPACGGSSEPRAEETPSDPVAVKTGQVERRTVDTYYIATATVRGRNTAVITSKGMGHVQEIHVHAGDEVQKGDILVEIEAADVRAGLSQARAGMSQGRAAIARAESNLERAKSARRLAEKTWKRMQELAERDATTEQQLDEAEARLENARAQEHAAESALSAARSQLAQAKASRQMASTQLGYRRVEAPFDGRVVSRAVDVGDMASPGTPLLTLEDPGVVRAEADVDESQAGHIQIGDEAHVDVQAADLHATGTVSQMVPAVDPGSRAFTVKVDLPADLANERLQPGMFARVRFPVGQAERLLVPASALSPRGSLERVFVVEDGLARLRLVTTGVQRDGEAEVLSGLTGGETVVLDPPPSFVDATPVEVQ